MSESKLRIDGKRYYKIAVVHKENSFSSSWIKVLTDRNYAFEQFNAHDPMLLEKLSKFEYVMWHWGPEESNYALSLIIVLERQGIKVFPNFNTAWHFDSKLAQHYLLKTCDVPIVPTWVFHNKIQALKWVRQTEFPVVFKLSGGASAMNVQLVHSERRARKLIRQAFGHGFSPVNKRSLLMNQIWHFKRDKTFRSFLGIVNGLRLQFVGKPIERIKSNEKGFVYFQKFIPQNDYDTRIIVIGSRAFAVRRYNRPNDFRASGSGVVAYAPENFDLKLFEMSFKLSDQIGMQSLACDYVYDADRNPLLIEISYGFITGSFYESCEGYWDRSLVWHDKPVRPETFILEDMLNGV